MGMPVKLSDDLVEAARNEAVVVDRSITAQIEHWAKIGRAVEALVSHSDIIALKNAKAGARDSAPSQATSEVIQTLFMKIATSPDRSAILDLLASRHQPTYGADPRWPGMVVRFDPDGTKTPGRFENRQFIPIKKKAATRTRAR